MARDLSARADRLGKLVITLGALDQPDIAGFRELGAWILGSAERHLPVAALHQHIGNSLGKRFALRYGEQVLLALGSGILDQSRVVELSRLREHRARHLDGVIERQRAN